MTAIVVPRPWPKAGRWLFVAGVTSVTAGVLLQVPDVLMVIRAHRMPDTMMPGDPDMSAHMAMWSPSMIVGMLLELAGLAAAVTGLFRDAPRREPAGGYAPEAIEHGELRPAHAVTCLVLTIALVVDIMKPLTLGFVLPGMREEYGVSQTVASTLPLVALTGTAIGSVVWGLLGDRYGRRTALLLATLLFLATSACGAMPTFGWNLVRLPHGFVGRRPAAAGLHPGRGAHAGGTAAGSRSAWAGSAGWAATSRPAARRSTSSRGTPGGCCGSSACRRRCSCSPCRP